MMPTRLHSASTSSMLCVVSTTLMPAATADGSCRLPGPEAEAAADAEAAEDAAVAWMMYDHIARLAPGHDMSFRLLSS